MCKIKYFICDPVSMTKKWFHLYIYIFIHLKLKIVKENRLIVIINKKLNVKDKTKLNLYLF